MINYRDGAFYNADCFDVLPVLPDGCVDMVLCDLPYGTTACSWDAILPFDKLWAEYWRVLKPNGAVVLTASQPFTSALVMSQPQFFRYEWVWVKNSPGGFAQAKNKPLTKHESVLVFSKYKTGHISQCIERMNYYPQDLKILNKEIKNSKGHRGSAFEARKNARDSYVQEFTGYPDSVLEFDVQRDGIHPTQKPVALFEYLIKTYTNPGEIVLDNTAGSGTTAVAARNTGRRWICIERDETYFKAANARLGS